ncbi:MAG TPA: Gar1/Naf1 family protein [Nitrososphaera sp.]|jgi:RNA-binding protein|nr:Gar1/Naf1 family protein [Nitrososphaera sp.]
MSLTNVGEIGEIMHLAKSGRLIVKLSESSASVRAGELLVDESGKRVGRVIELIGPVSAPYASVIPMTDRTSRLVGSKVFSGGFIKTSRSQGKGSGRYKRRQRR